MTIISETRLFAYFSPDLLQSVELKHVLPSVCADQFHNVIKCLSAPFIDTRININSVPAVTCLALHSKCRVSVLPKCIHTLPALKEPVFCLSKRGTYVSFFSSLKRENEARERERRKEAGRISQLISASMKAESVQRGPLCTHSMCRKYEIE